MVGVSLGTVSVLVIGTGEEYLVGLSLGLTIGPPIEYPDPGAELHGTLMVLPLGLCFCFEAVRCLCCF